MKKEWKIDIPVALIFFNKPQTLKKVFDVIKEVGPSKLFLIQDGPRNKCASDKIKIEECRKIVEDIDWNCEVYKNYSVENLSCDYRVYTGIDWAFKYVDQLIILEDDVIPSKTFFYFCKELLEKYKYDERIGYITGMNHLGECNYLDSSYLFSQVGAGCAWATWRRVWDDVELNKDYNFLKNKEAVNLTNNFIKKSTFGIHNNLLEKCKEFSRKDELLKKINSWETNVGIATLLNSRLVVTPRVNLISNIGITQGATHGPNDIRKLPAATQKYFFKPIFHLSFPLKHPHFVMRDVNYERIYKKAYSPNFLCKQIRRIEAFIRKMIFSTKIERRELFIKKFNKKNKI